MKRKITPLLLALLIATLLGSVGCATSQPNISELESQGYEIRLYQVFGMDCPGCHAGLQNLVNQVAGVKMSLANWEKKELRVVIEKGAEVTDEAIHTAIKEANFTPGERVK